MMLFNKPIHFYEFLSHHDLIDDIYKAMESPDLADPVMTVLRILKKTNTLPALLKDSKSETKSTGFRNEGNAAYTNKKYQIALICYNKALLYAPKYSRAMKLAYSNRSALLLKVKAFSAAINDIETCFSMGCPLDIIDKLKKRREEARGCIWMEKLAESAKSTIFSEDYFQFNLKRNPQIPCASTDVGVLMKNQMPKIVATTDVKVGTLLAVETAFVSQNDPQNSMFSCHFCHKMNLNLKPCDGCCLALFCDEECRQNCLKYYHGTECSIIEILETISMGTMTRLAVKALLKMKYLSKSWKELISASHSMGINRIKTSSINEIYDTNSMFSLLNVKDMRHFLNGPLYNFSFTCASIIHYLETIHGLFPQNEEDKSLAVRAVARLLMFLTLYSNHTQMILSVSIHEHEKTGLHEITNYGWFSFIGKLKNSCTPNTLAVGLNNKIGLLAIAPIKKGTELTVSYVGHWLDNLYEKEIRNRDMFVLYGVVCNCPVCTEEYTNENNRLTDVQRKSFRKLNLDEMRERFNPRNIPEIYAKLCKSLACLSEVPFSDEYDQVFRLFRKCVLFLQDLSTRNIILDYV